MQCEHVMDQHFGAGVRGAVRCHRSAVWKLSDPVGYAVVCSQHIAVSAREAAADRFELTKLTDGED